MKQTDEVKKVCLRLDNLKYYYLHGAADLLLIIDTGKGILKDKHDLYLNVLPN